MFWFILIKISLGHYVVSMTRCDMNAQVLLKAFGCMDVRFKFACRLYQ